MNDKVTYWAGQLKINIIQYFWAGHEWDLLASSRVSLTDRSPTWQPAEWAIVGKLPPVWSNSSRRLFANYHYLVLGLEHFHHNGCWEKTNAPTHFIAFSFLNQLLDLVSLRDRDVCKVCLCFNIKPGYLDNSDRRRALIHYFLIHLNKNERDNFWRPICFMSAQGIETVRYNEQRVVNILFTTPFSN